MDGHPTDQRRRNLWIGVTDNDTILEVSRRLREEYENGRYYYLFHGNRLHHLPINLAEHPSNELLIWHNERVFRSWSRSSRSRNSDTDSRSESEESAAEKSRQAGPLRPLPEPRLRGLPQKENHGRRACGMSRNEKSAAPYPKRTTRTRIPRGLTTAMMFSVGSADNREL